MNNFLKEKILKYAELNPNILYFDLVKVFGLPMEKLFELLDIDNYYFDKYDISVYGNNGKCIYRENSEGYWVKYKYDNIVKKINGKWKK